MASQLKTELRIVEQRSMNNRSIRQQKESRRQIDGQSAERNAIYEQIRVIIRVFVVILKK